MGSGSIAVGEAEALVVRALRLISEEEICIMSIEIIHLISSFIENDRIDHFPFVATNLTDPVTLGESMSGDLEAPSHLTMNGRPPRNSSLMPSNTSRGSCLRSCLTGF